MGLRPTLLQNTKAMSGALRFLPGKSTTLTRTIIPQWLNRKYLMRVIDNSHKRRWGLKSAAQPVPSIRSTTVAGSGVVTVSSKLSKVPVS